MTMITPSYLGETIEYSSLHACRSTLEDPTGTGPAARPARDQNWGPAVNRAAADLAARLGTRLRRGIEVIVAASSH